MKRNNISSSWSKQSGASIVGVLMAAAIGGVVVLAISKAMLNMMRTQTHLELKGDRLSVKNSIMRRVDCNTTFTTKVAKSCSPGKLVGLFHTTADGDQKTIISKDGTRFGKWIYRAECNDDASGLTIRAARPKAGVDGIKEKNRNKFFKDPLTKKIITWDDDGSLLLPQGVSLCSKYSPREITTLYGAYTGTCHPGTWVTCKDTQTIELGAEPVYVSIHQVANDDAYSVYPSQARKFDGMNGGDGWQSNTSVNGVSVQSGGANARYWAVVKFTTTGFIVRKYANVDWSKYHPVYANSYRYIAHVKAFGSQE